MNSSCFLVYCLSSRNLRLNSQYYPSLENVRKYSMVSESLDVKIVPPGVTECLADAKCHHGLVGCQELV
jgi:hypothetical protein